MKLSLLWQSITPTQHGTCARKELTMRESMLGKILVLVVTVSESNLGTLVDLMEKLVLGEHVADWWLELKLFLRKEPTWVTKGTQAVKNLLQSIGEVAFPGAVYFVASKQFVKDTSQNAKVKISGFGSNFTNRFLTKVEANVAPSRLGYGKLLRKAKDAIIIAFLGGEKKSETSLAEIFHLVSLQPDGPISQEGALLTNGCANIFYVYDIDEVLCTVDVYWLGGGWRFDAYPTAGGYEWLGGRRVFSRNLSK